MVLRFSSISLSGPLAWHRGSVCTSHPAAQGSTPGSAVIFLLNNAKFVDSIERSNTSSGQAMDFANTDSGKGMSYVLQKIILLNFKFVFTLGSSTA